MSVPCDYYAVLGVERASDARDIKRAYRSAARRLHPDLPANKGNRDAARQFRMISEAYEVLVDPERRRRYDLTGRDGGVTWKEGMATRSSAGSRGFEPEFHFQTRAGEGMASIFEDLFAVDPAVAADANTKVDSPWQPSELGRKMSEDAPPGARQRAASSATREAGGATAARPLGLGPEEWAERALADDLLQADAAVTEQQKHIESLDARDPMEQFVDEHAFLRREGRNVLLDLPLTPAEAAGGCDIEVPTTTGSARVRIPPGVRPGQRIRLRDRGLPHLGGQGRGHQVLVVRVELPPHLEPDQLALLRQLDEITGFRPRAGLWEPETLVEVEEIDD